MALVQKKISKAKQIKLAVVLLLVVSITIYAAYFGLFKKSAPDPKSGATEAKTSGAFKQSLAPPQKSAFESIVDLGKNSVFNSLRSFGSWPLSDEPKGRSQPFIEVQK